MASKRRRPLPEVVPSPGVDIVTDAGIRTRLRLPFEARQGGLEFYFMRCVFVLGIASLMVALGHTVTATVMGWPTRHASPSGVTPGYLLFVAAKAAPMLYFASMLYRDLAAALSGNGAITLQEDSFWDRRMTYGPVPWSEVSRATAVRTRWSYGVRIELHSSVNLKRKSVGSGWSATTVKVEVASFDKPGDVLIQAICEMVRKHGGEVVDPKQPKSLHRGGNASRP